jgi:hypothetical protein
MPFMTTSYLHIKTFLSAQDVTHNAAMCCRGAISIPDFHRDTLHHVYTIAFLYFCFFMLTYQEHPIF